MLGVSYKPGVGDIRESPALKIIALLRELGAEVVYHDPHVPDAARVRPAQRCRSRRRSTDADLALIVTAHPGVDHDADRRGARACVVDLRGVTRAARAAANVVRL